MAQVESGLRSEASREKYIKTNFSLDLSTLTIQKFVYFAVYLNLGIMG
jgi:hypothetical protein